MECEMNEWMNEWMNETHTLNLKMDDTFCSAIWIFGNASECSTVWFDSITDKQFRQEPPFDTWSFHLIPTYKWQNISGSIVVIRCKLWNIYRLLMEQLAIIQIIKTSCFYRTLADLYDV